MKPIRNRLLELAAWTAGATEIAVAAAAEAEARWRQLRGRSGVLHTGHCVIDAGTGARARAVASTTVHFAAVSDAEIRRTSPAELADLPANFWEDAELVAPSPKRAISLRLDEDVLDWFRRSGPRYQTRMNAVLRMYVKRMRKHVS